LESEGWNVGYIEWDQNFSLLLAQNYLQPIQHLAMQMLYSSQTQFLSTYCVAYALKLLLFSINNAFAKVEAALDHKFYLLVTSKIRVNDQDIANFNEDTQQFY
jgi:hypothetical protein